MDNLRTPIDELAAMPLVVLRSLAHTFAAMYNEAVEAMVDTKETDLLQYHRGRASAYRTLLATVEALIEEKEVKHG